ncbi:MAG: penicillin-binding protein 2, partial [Proteobacteria bacterium]|nr:penicillin-binding protein 2 [Pseudomonadota bacterium]
FFWGSAVVLGVILLLWLRMWHLQIYRGEHYRRISENNRIRKIDIPAPRGVIYDAWGKVVLGNTPSSDLVIIPQYIKDFPTTFSILGRLLHQTPETFEKRYRSLLQQPPYMPINLQRNLSQHEVAVLEGNKTFLPGVEVRTTARREYPDIVSPHMLGYLGEISTQNLADFNLKNRQNPYFPGDLVGKQGLEAKWERYLRGKRGYRMIQVDAHGRTTSIDSRIGDDWQLPEIPAVPGSSLELTLDMEIQRAILEGFTGKNGAVIALNPKNGAILGLISQPGWDPYMYQRGMSVEEFRAMSLDPFHPFIDKTSGGEYPPGSTYKAVVALAALQEGVVNPSTTYNCPGYFTLGSQTFGCHNRKGHGAVNLRRALMQSCDVFFYHIGIELGVDRIAKYAKDFGLGSKLGLDLNLERPGIVPTEEWKKSTRKEPWIAGETPPVAIGQGYNLMTPLQMASLYASIANKGSLWRPFLVKRVVNHLGEVIEERLPEKIRTIDSISQENFDLVQKGLEAVVMDDEGTGKNARVPNIRIAGKTGSVQVVNLKKNKNQTDVSVLWKEHAMFASFAPVEDPEIVVIVVSEHDEKGGGGASAAPVAGVILNKYFELKSKRQGTSIGKGLPSDQIQGVQ